MVFVLSDIVLAYYVLLRQVMLYYYMVMTYMSKRL